MFTFLFTVQTVVANEMLDRLNVSSKGFSGAERSAFLDVLEVDGRLIAVGRRGVIVYSDDGMSWQQASVPVSVTLTAVSFPDDNNGWVVGHSGVILHSEDKGETWALQFDGDQAIKGLLAIAQQKVSAVKADIDRADEQDKEDLEYDLEDAELLLSDAEFDYEMGPANPFLDVWFKNNKHGYVVGAYGLFFETRDGGESWQAASGRLENFDKFHLNAISGIKGGGVLIVGEAGAMFASYNQGEDWETLYPPYQGSYFGLQATKIDGEVFAYGLKGHAFVSSDTGQTWQQIDLGVETTITSSTLSRKGAVALVGFSGVVLTSENGGQHFIRQEKNNFKAYTGAAYFNLGNSGVPKLVLISNQGIDPTNE